MKTMPSLLTSGTGIRPLIEAYHSKGMGRLGTTPNKMINQAVNGRFDAMVVGMAGVRYHQRKYVVEDLVEDKPGDLRVTVAT